MTASAPIGISPEAMRALLEQAVREHVAIRRKAMNTTPGLVASLVADHEALLRSLHKGNPACAQLFAPDFFLLHKNSSPNRLVDGVLCEFNKGLVRRQSFYRTELTSVVVRLSAYRRPR
jgi:hypothetical protein